MKEVVLITRENAERTTHVSVYLCGDYTEAKHFCRFANRLSLADGEKIVARIIKANAEYSLEKYIPFTFDDIVKFDDRTIQIILRNFDISTLAVALKDAKKEVKDVFFRNLSGRSAGMLKEEIEDIYPVVESEIENVRQNIINLYKYVTSEDRFDNEWYKFNKLKEYDNENQSVVDNTIYIILVFRGTETIAGYVSVYLFDKYLCADNFCNYLNKLKQEKGIFIYARYADQMVEYETVKPLLVCFDQIFECIRIYGDNYGNRIIREVFKNFKTHTLLNAFKGLDKRSRMFVMQSLPIKITDEINELIDYSYKYNDDLCTLGESRKAQQRIIDAINKIAEKYRQGKIFNFFKQ